MGRRLRQVAEEAAAAPEGRPTLKSIAFMMGLGVTTVSRALKDAPEIGEETRRRVQMVARQVGYRPNRAGVRLRTGKTNVISLILDTEDDMTGFVSDIIYGITDRIAESPYHLVVTPYSRRRDPMEPVRYVVETGSADGIIISRTEPADKRVRYLLEHGFPFATHGRTELDAAHPFHDFDNQAFARMAVEALVARGRSRLALLPPPPGLTYRAHMRAGFSAALSDAGLPEYPLGDLSIDASIDEIRDRIRAVAASRSPPDGYVSASGAGAFALVAGLEAAGQVLGREADVVSKQSTKLLRWFRPELRLVEEDFRLAGRELANAVMKAIDGADPAGLQSLANPSGVMPLTPC
ncbi:MAG: LacI family transcriptional regulator [Rhizobiaceae bacterium]|nr:LacI family transcriptional regulator [Rhizobiaceae bacterium]MCV0407142.1 LacI family transcriptional regulator [Rhizobiaceae bacterium]